jgi:(2Fe-2S) ferredoxin
MQEEAGSQGMHVFVCQHARNGGKASCAREGTGPDLLETLKVAVREAGLESVRVVRAGCLGPCEKGPNILVYPERIWFHGVTVGDVGRLVARLQELATASSPVASVLD